MSEVQTTKRTFLRHEDFSERDWHPRCCIKLTWIHKVYLRQLLKCLIRKRVGSSDGLVTVEISEEDFTYLYEIVNHLDQARFVKTSISGLATYGKGDSGNFATLNTAHRAEKKNLQR